MIDLAISDYMPTKPRHEQVEYWDQLGMLGSYDTDPAYAEAKHFIRNKPDTAWVNVEDGTFFAGQYYTAINLLRKNGVNVDKYLYTTMPEQQRKLGQLYWGYGIYRRTNNTKSLMSDPFRVGRDQQKPVISAESFDKKSWKRVLPFIGVHFLTRLGLFDAKLKQNGTEKWKFPTFTGPTIWASYIRYAISINPIFWVLYPLLLVLDLEIVINTLVKQGPQKADTDVNNHIVYAIWFHSVAPTPLTYLNLQLMDWDHFELRLNEYYDRYGRPWVVGQLWLQVMKIYKPARSDANGEV